MDVTPELRTRIEQSIAECDRYIALESSRSADLRPAHVAETLAHRIAHRAKLAGWIDSGRADIPDPFAK